jgi:hypothetical protein
MKPGLNPLRRARFGVGLVLAVGLSAPVPVHNHAPGKSPSHVELTGGCAGRTGAQHLHESHAVPAPRCLACAVGLAGVFAPETGPVLAGLDGAGRAVAVPAESHGIFLDLRVAARGPPTFSLS